MNAKQMQCSAWYIFKYVEERFEKRQLGQTGPFGSGFSPEDLPSNLILFHRMVYGLSRVDINSLCGVITKVNDNERIFEGFP